MYGWLVNWVFLKGGGVLAVLAEEQMIGLENDYCWYKDVCIV